MIFKKSEFWMTAGLLLGSNVFMTLAWYGHLKFKHQALWVVILASWGLAFFEYILQVPANRIGSYEMTAPQLKILQEVITFSVFSVFSVLYLNQTLSINDWLAFGLIVMAVALSLFQPLSL